MDEPRPTPSVSSLRSPGSPSIMRRLSRGAMEKFQSRRKSSTASTGPVTRRSSSSSAQPPDDDDQPSDAPPEVPSSLANGVPFLRITRRKRIQYMFSIDAEKGTLSWDSKTKKGEISIDSIKEIRVADDARNYREEFKISAEHENLWVTILYTTEKKLKGLHIIALSKDSFDQFVSTLRRLLKYRQDIMSSLSIPGEQFVHVHWPTYITKEEGEERLSYEGVEKLARRLHVNCSKAYLRQKFMEADVDHSGFLDFEEFRNFVKMLKHRAEIVQIFKRVREATAPREELAVEDETLSLEMFKSFIKTVQRQSIDESLALKIYYKFVDEYQRFTVDSFTDYLLSSYNAVHKPVEGELSRPLNEYYISSSHNTYLLGRQVVGDSSVEAYIRVLQRGCRCVELDCWDGVDGPVISHGRTFTSEISFADVISAIHKFGFISSPYPLILSLEIHCSAENQMKMTEIMKSTFGDKLVTSPAALKLLSLPSPEELKHKVLIKVKASDEENRDMLGNETFTATNGTSESTETSQSEDNSGTEATGGNGIIPRRRKPKSSGTSKIAKSLGDLGVYVRGVKYRNFSLPESRTLTHCFSFGERSFNSICKDEESLSQLENHNKRYLMRVYPSGFRLTSSNYDPIVCWKRGVQMAALNWQTYDIGLQMNDAMFSVGDRSGYVLKPEMLRTVKGHHEAATKLHRRKFLLDVISAQQLPRPKDLKPDDAFDPSVEVELFTADGPVQRMRTKVVRNNGFNPIWNERMSVDVFGPLFELAFVRFQVYSTDGSAFAVFCGRLVNLQHGYRHVPLFDMQGEQFLFSTLFVRISVRDE